MNEKFSECQRPFSPCWCETRQNNTHCKNAPSAPIDDPVFIIFAIVVISIYVYFLIKPPKIKKPCPPQQNH